MPPSDPGAHGGDAKGWRKRDGSVRVPFNDGGMLRVFLTEETVIQPGKENKQERGE